MAVGGGRSIGVDELNVIDGEDRLVVCGTGGGRGGGVIGVGVAFEHGGFRLPVFGAAAAALSLAFGFAAHC